MQIKCKIDDKEITVDKGISILEAAKLNHVTIPTLCHVKLDAFNVEGRAGSCRICVVEVKGQERLLPACSTMIMEGMEIYTHTPKTLNARRINLELLLSDHPHNCLFCIESGNCELQELAANLNITSIDYDGEQSTYKIDSANKSILRDPNKCIMCRRCETACNVLQTVGVLSGTERGFKAVVDTFNHSELSKTECTFCGQCVSICPTGALSGINYNAEILKALYDPQKIVIVQTAPAVRVAIGELFGMQPGTEVTGKMVTALKKMHFNYVLDTNFAADLTIMEEATELIDRINTGKSLPILTSCCPAWVNFLEYQFPNLIDIPSTAKSPQQMFGAIAKSYFAKVHNIDPKNIVVVSVMPCLAKKYEASRPEFATNGYPDVDYVMTTRELGALLKESGIDLAVQEDSKYDSLMGESTGAADIFGTAGGVLEAALRTAYYMVNNKSLEDVDFKDVRGIDGLKEAEVDLGKLKVKVAQASGLGNARKLLQMIQNKERSYHAIEIMACPGGCINGGGQPFIYADTTLVQKRSSALYKLDAAKKVRASYLNPEIVKLYKDFLGKPGGELSHKLLHTHYFKREILD